MTWPVAHYMFDMVSDLEGIALATLDATFRNLPAGTCTYLR